MNKSAENLVSQLERLGVAEAEDVAKSQIDEGIPHLHRLLFLKRAWEQIVSEDDTSWPERTAVIEDATSTAPFAGVSHALSSMLAQGINPDEIVDLVRGVQAQLLFDLCYMFDDPGLEEEEFQDVIWGIFSLDGQLKPVQPIQGLFEDVLSTDPTGREMRPRGR